MNISVGDYLLTRDKMLYRIMNIEQTFGTFLYDIKSLRKVAVTNSEYIGSFEEASTGELTHWEHSEIKGISHIHIERLGTIIKEKDYKASLEILY